MGSLWPLRYGQSMQFWLIPAVLSVLFWGLWGFFGKMASAGLPPRSVFFIESIVALVVAAGWMATHGFKFDAVSSKGFLYAALTGIALAFGQIFFFVALSRGKASVVIIMTSLYPLITIALAFLVLRETISWTQGLGVVLALLALPLLSL